MIAFQKVIENGVGTKNNMVSVKQSDFEVFQALAKDSESVSQTQQSKYFDASFTEQQLKSVFTSFFPFFFR